MLIFVFARLKLQLQNREEKTGATLPMPECKNIYANPLNDKQLIKMIYMNVSMAFNATHTHNTIK